MSLLSGRPASPWIHGSPVTTYPSLDGDLSVDVVVIGGGIAGLTAALLLKRAGASVALVEAGRVGRGVSGHSTAKVTSQHGLAYGSLASSLDEASARIYAESNQSAIERVAAFVAEEQIDCAFERAPAYLYAEREDAVGAVEREAAAARSLGLPASLVMETELPYPVARALRFGDQAQFDPYAYLTALARGIPGEGSHVLERTRATGVSEGEPCQVETARGTIVAGDVIVATHLPFLDRGGFFARTHPERSYALAVRAEGAEGLAGMYLSADGPTRSIRAHRPPSGAEALLLVGGEGHKVGQGGSTSERYRALEEWTRERFTVRSVEYRWSTQDNMPADGLPFIGLMTPLSTRLYVATGFRKWGMTNGTVAGMVLSDAILKRRNLWASLYDPSRVRAAAAARSFASENLNVARVLVGDRFARPRREPGGDLAVGEARVTRSASGEAVALYRDDDAVLHSVSAVCTHLGCLVRFNDAERSWDCPCHGSRFDPEGRVLQGPAVSGLERREV